MSSHYTHKGKYLKAPIKIIGGKTKTRDVIYSLEPEGTKWYMEPFLGSGAILIGKKKHDFETVGDINSDIINFYQDIQNRPEELWDQIQFLLPALEQFDKEFFIYLRDHKPRGVGRSAWFYLINKSCMNGIVRYNKTGACNSSYCGTTQGRGWLTKEWFSSVVERIKHVEFFCLDYSEILRMAESNCWVVCDSPYSDNETTYNADRWGHDRFEEYEENLRKCRGKVLITINDNKFIRGLFKSWNIREAEYFYSCSQTAKGRGMKKELIIRNYW